MTGLADGRRHAPSMMLRIGAQKRPIVGSS